jgi:hypothetical protein
MSFLLRIHLIEHPTYTAMLVVVKAIAIFLPIPQVSVGILKYKVNGVPLAETLTTDAVLLIPLVVRAYHIIGFVFCHISYLLLSIRDGVASFVSSGVLKIGCISFSALCTPIAVEDFFLPYSLVFLIKVFPIGFVSIARTVASYGSVEAFLMAGNVHLSCPP